MSYYDKHKVITCITLLAMEVNWVENVETSERCSEVVGRKIPNFICQVAPPEEQAKSFKFTKQLGQHPFPAGNSMIFQLDIHLLGFRP